MSHETTFAPKRFDRDALEWQLRSISIMLGTTSTLIQHGLQTDKRVVIYVGDRLRIAMDRMVEAGGSIAFLIINFCQDRRDPEALQTIMDKMLANVRDLERPINAKKSESPVMALREEQAEWMMLNAAKKFAALAVRLGEAMRSGEIS